MHRRNPAKASVSVCSPRSFDHSLARRPWSARYWDRGRRRPPVTSRTLQRWRSAAVARRPSNVKYPALARISPELIRKAAVGSSAGARILSRTHRRGNPFPRGSPADTPKAFRPPAQGCRAAATLGSRAVRFQPQRGCVVLRASERCGRKQTATQPVGVGAGGAPLTQGSACRRNPGLEDTAPLGQSGRGWRAAIGRRRGLSVRECTSRPRRPRMHVDAPASAMPGGANPHTPKAFRPPAQGCRAAATLGQ